MSSVSEQQRRNRIVVPILIVLVAGLLIAAIFVIKNGASNNSAPIVQSEGNQLQVESNTQGKTPESKDSEENQAAPEQTPPDLSHVEARDPNDPLTAGPVDAPVVMVVFSDYQCGYCAKWSADTLPTMLQYADQGKLRIEWRDVNVFGEDSERAATAAYAAGLQGKFWEYHDGLFPNGTKRSPAELTQDALTKLAEDLGLDKTKFVADMNSEQTTTAIQRNAALGRDLGVASTPSFLVGGQPVVGAQPTEVFVKIIDQKLADLAG